MYIRLLGLYTFSYPFTHDVQYDQISDYWFGGCNCIFFTEIYGNEVRGF